MVPRLTLSPPPLFLSPFARLTPTTHFDGEEGNRGLLQPALCPPRLSSRLGASDGPAWAISEPFAPAKPSRLQLNPLLLLVAGLHFGTGALKKCLLMSNQMRCQNYREGWTLYAFLQGTRPFPPLPGRQQPFDRSSPPTSASPPSCRMVNSLPKPILLSNENRFHRTLLPAQHTRMADPQTISS